MFPVAAPAPAAPRPYSVSELLAEVAATLRTSWREVAVVGEIGRWDLRGGHGYFTLKDSSGCLGAVIFSSDLRRIPFQPEAGLEVLVRGTLDLWAPQGKFQIRASRIEPVGAGALRLAFEQLKAKLAAEGLFDRARKRPIPAFPSRIGIVTSPHGAAVRDILNVIRRRFDGLSITIYPVRVQGEGAAAEIASAIRELGRRGGFDVLILARGGGSVEDLAPFNDERVARALAGSSIPTISAVGHETDVTIVDFVADLRAPTPSAAAELVVQRKEDLRRRVAELRSRTERALRGRLGLGRARLNGLSRAEGLLRLKRRLRELKERVAQSRNALVQALERSPADQAARLARLARALESFPRRAGLARRRDRLASFRSLLEERTSRRLERGRERLERAAGRLDALSPLAVLARGYAVAFREGSRAPLLSATGLRIGDRVRVRLHQGEIGTVVREPVRGDPGPLFSDPKAGEGER